jgi:uncharacterized membrane-anchored protein
MRNAYYRRAQLGAVAAFALFLLTTTMAGAQTKKQAEEQKAALAAVKKVLVNGPADVPLLDQATLKLPEGFSFVPGKEARAIVTARGGKADNIIGIIFQTDGDWAVGIGYVKAGYIKDNDAKDWSPDDMLDQFRTTLGESNKERLARGIAPLEITGWIEKPTYDATTHKLKWSVALLRRGAPASEPQMVTYSTYTLGREGYIVMNLGTTTVELEALKPVAAQLLASLSFNEGKRYTDFNSATDQIAEIGLAALIGGVAAKKLGLIALAAGFFTKFFNLIVVAAAVVGAALVRFFRRNKPVPVAAPPSPPEPPTPGSG